ncbi:retrovirus-related pol polyprotein from transposon TNT 1-94 [Tanacetum coccineum]
MKVEESSNVTFDETPPSPKTSPLEDDDLVEEEAINVNETRPLGNDVEDKSLENNEIINIKESKSHPLENIIGNLNQRTLRSQASEKVPNPKDMTIIGTKWVYRNKLDENGVVSRNKARLVAQGYNQQEGINYDETYAPVARLESIRILLACACALDFKLFQMDVKSAFLNGFTNEEVYVAQPPGFIDFAKPNHVYRLKKALYGLNQAPKAWYGRLKAFLIKHNYTMGMQTVLAISTTEAEYVSVEKACQQALWMKQALVDYGIRLDDIPIMCDNKGTIDLSKNPVQHSRTKHIEIHHHFLCDNVQKGNISIEKVLLEDNIADILTKPLKHEPFNYLRLAGVSTAQRLQRKYAKCLLLLIHTKVNAASENMLEVTTASEYQINAANMDQDSAHMLAASKVPMLKPGEYEIWRIRIEQYIQMIDYPLWEVIKNGVTLPKTTTMEGVMTVMPITTAE